MSDGGLMVLDGTHLRTVADLSPPLTDGDGCVTGAQVLEIAESRASLALSGVSSPGSLKSAALRRIGIGDDVSFRSALHDREKAASLLKSYVDAVADVLKDEPIVVANLDGKTLRIFLEDEDDFAMLAESLFTDLDTEDIGKISKSELRNALVHMGVEMGVPPLSDFPELDEILKKHGAQEEEELGQAQFAQVLQPVLQDLADALSVRHVTIVQNIKVSNGSKLRKLLADEKQVNSVIEKLLQEKHEEKNAGNIQNIIRSFLEKNGGELGLPPLRDDDAVVLLYDTVLSDLEDKSTTVSQKDDLVVLFKDIIEKFAEQLEANPIVYDFAN